MINVVYFMAGNRDLAGQCWMSIDSIRQFHPDARFFIFTDFEVQFSGAETIRIPEVKRDDLMPASTLACFAFTRRPEFRECPTLFLDTDVLMNAPFAMPAADALVTYRDNLGNLSDAMPFNTGVIAVAPTDEGELFVNVYHLLTNQKQGNLRAWYGDQVALSEMMGGMPDKTGPKAIAVRVNGNEDRQRTIVVQIEHCNTHNWTPENGDSVPGNRVFIHLKGPRKQWMAGYLRDIKIRGAA